MQNCFFRILTLTLFTLNLFADPKNIQHIDCIYSINLDERPEKWERTLSELAPYGITPKRFSAINGWKLSPQKVNELLLTFLPGMQGGRWACFFSSDREQLKVEHDFLTEKSYGRSFAADWLSPGAIGCSLSHLSVLKEAYEAGYETIWVIEDDIVVHKDPHLLSALIEKLDLLVGKEGWDILYTDTDEEEEGNGNRDEKHDLSHIWRPDADPSIFTLLPKREKLEEPFVKIHSRTRTHSMIIRRSGMKKIIEHLNTHKIFLPYDDELSLVPNISLFNLTHNIVSFIKNDPISDTQKNILQSSSKWPEYKQKILLEGQKILGCHYLLRDGKLLDFLHDKKPKSCVEIGTFGGLISYQIAKTLDFLQEGSLHSIDAWDCVLAAEGVKERALSRYWSDLDMETIYQGFQKMLKTQNIEKYCHPIRQDSRKAAALFQEDSIDFLYIDGNFSPEGSLQDVLLYFPKVKKGGYIWLNGARLPTKHASVAFLMKHCTWIKEYSAENKSILLQKK
jgi:GR25 family glycosyltransferase involved in LPS biosynthesis